MVKAFLKEKQQAIRKQRAIKWLQKQRTSKRAKREEREELKLEEEIIKREKLEKS